jgi:hypothetical protein
VAHHLSILQGPSKATAGEVLAPSVKIGVMDAYENPTGNATVTITANGPGAFATQSVTTVQAVNGVATFDQLSLTKSGEYTLTAQTTGLASVNSSQFTILQGAPTRMNVLTQPVSTTAGIAIPNFSLEVTDDFDNRTNYTGEVTVSPNGPGGIVSGATTVSGVAGVVTFTGLTINRAGTYTITVAGSGIANRVTDSFSVKSASATQISVASNPSSSRPADTLAPIVVHLLDPFGNLSTANATVTISITSGSTTTVNVVNGIATFSNLVLNKAGNYAFSLSSGSLPVANLSNFEVIPFDFTVNTLADALVGSGSDITLRQAIALANLQGGFSTISFGPELTGTLYLDPSLGALPAIDANVTIKTLGNDPLTINGTNSPCNGIFKIMPGSAVVISGLNLSGGSAADGGAINNAGLLKLSTVYITNSTATGFGGAVYNAAGGTISIDTGTFSGNSAARGGAI